MSLKSKAYSCNSCSEDFKSTFDLVKHLRRVKNGQCPSRYAKCPECKEMYSSIGLASHRHKSHGISGTSRWTMRAREKKASAQVDQMLLGSGAANFSGEVDIKILDHKDVMLKEMKKRLTFHEEQVKRHSRALKTVGVMIKRLKGMKK